VSNPYSTTKAQHHPEVVKAFQEGRSHLMYPVQIHLMPQNHCNHDCHFCVVSGTLVATPGGAVPIESVIPGMRIAIGDNLENTVRSVGSRAVSQVYEVELDDGRKLRITGEHPIYTAEGFMGADAISAGDWVAATVPVWMREPGQTDHSRPEVALGDSPAWPPERWTQGPQRGVPEGVFGADEEKQPHEEPGDRGQGHGSHAEGRVSEICGGGGQGSGGFPPEDGQRPEPHEDPGVKASGGGVELGGQGEVKDGGVVRGSDSRLRRGVDGRWTVSRVGWEEFEVPGLQGDWAESGNRSLSVGVLQRERPGAEDGRELRDADDQPLRECGLALPCADLSTEPLQTEAGEPSPFDHVNGRVVYRGRLVRGLEFRRVSSVRKLRGDFTVHNLSVEECEAYVAGGILVHNCSYRLSNWKNSTLFNDSVCIPWDVMERLLHEFHEMGVKAIEVTGGGEPTIYPHWRQMIGLIGELGFDLGLVTNGTGLTEARVRQLVNGARLKWARVSIDAGNPKQYSEIRRVPESHWHKAWEAVAMLAEAMGGDPEHRLGVGYVVSGDSYDGIYGAAKMAYEAGADNMRISVAFTPEADGVLTPEQVAVAHDGAREAQEHFGESLQVVDLIDERIENLSRTTQDYSYCGTKDLLCVVEGECKVYTCCTLTGDPRGLMGDVRDRSFRDLWEEMAPWRKRLNPCEVCTCACLYEERNKAMLSLMDKPLHGNFI
jgi:MoaA/NifB/PqqE/SkfB family radical SAM enzyme